VAQRVVVPPSWVALASDATLCTAPSHKTLAEHQVLAKGDHGDKKRKADQTVPAYYNTCANKRVMALPSAPHHSAESVCARPEAHRSEFPRTESEIKQIVPATPSRGGSVAVVERQETEQPLSTSTGVCLRHASTLLQQEESSRMSEEGEVVEDTSDQSATFSDAEKIRVEFERMKRMYEEFISK